MSISQARRIEIKFGENKDELQKIIKEITPPKLLEEALEFLEAIQDGFNDLMEEYKDEVDDLEDKIRDLENDNDDFESELTVADIGLGSFEYSETELNIDFKAALEEFLEGYRNRVLFGK